ncbi:hypothetical protein GCM10011309_09610 [Litorimonas cladophorae]|uniref:Uncharacterized protein n=1 Tax=Litorimonas cladophorae TaxID=1220491 RepID=A0A918NEN1_9PROT|nr:hypothetical protein [Litorimonas cladophorae]GGX61739.1 hypothetical protein GCM10011309_09610 [Litorimonas cladophorae]
MRLPATVLILSLPLFGAAAHAKPDQECAGTWSIEMLKDENYTPWHAYTQNPPYPVKLIFKIDRPRAAIFTDNKGRDCSIGYLNDVDNDVVVFRHCLKPKYPEIIPIHYKVSCKGDQLVGKIVSYKDLFEINGVRIDIGEP